MRFLNLSPATSREHKNQEIHRVSFVFTCDEPVAEPVEAIESSLRLSLTFHSYLFARPIRTLASARTVTLAQATNLADAGFEDVKEHLLLRLFLNYT